MSLRTVVKLCMLAAALAPFAAAGAGAASPNDDFADAALIEGSKGQVEGSTRFATLEPDEDEVTCCGSRDPAP